MESSKNKKILVLGKTGMLGHMVFDYFSDLNKYEVIGFDRDSFDATDYGKNIEKKIAEFSPDYVINCIGLINKYANSNEELAKKINSVFPHFLAYLGIKHGWKLIHISSDCYLDEDIYGKSKFFGEVNDGHNITIRTSIIGPELKEGFGLFHWFMSQKNNVKGFTKAHWDGVTTLQLSKFIQKIIDSEKKYSGILDYRTKESINKYGLLDLISKIFNKKIEIQEDRREMKDKRNFEADKWSNKDYETQLNELKNYMQENKEKYEFYFGKN